MVPMAGRLLRSSSLMLIVGSPPCQDCRAGKGDLTAKVISLSCGIIRLLPFCEHQLLIEPEVWNNEHQTCEEE